MGSLSSIVMGGSMPVYAILFAEVLGVLSKDADTARSESVFWSLMFLVTGVVVGLAMFFQVSNNIPLTENSSVSGASLKKAEIFYG